MRGSCLNACAETVWPDYDQCGVNLAASILAHYGIGSGHATLPVLDGYLNRGYRNVVLLLLDGLGAMTLEEAFSENSFLKKRRIGEMSAVFPSTTTAATTSLRTGMTPVEHGWLGWTLYFQQIGKSVDIFSNREQFTGEMAADFHAASTFLPVRDITDLITGTGRAEGAAVSAHDRIFAPDMPRLTDRVEETCLRGGRHYIYAYFGEPDATMHVSGIHSRDTLAVLRRLDEQVGELSARLPEDTLLLVTADHGLADTQPAVIEEHPDVMRMLIRPPVMEPRAAALYVKAEHMNDFPEAFKAAFGGAFHLITCDEALDTGLFGAGRMRAGLRDLIGDYVAIAVGSLALYHKRDRQPLIGMHAGLTRREMRVPLIVAKE